MSTANNLNGYFSVCVTAGQTLTGLKDKDLDACNANPAAASQAWHGAYGLISQKTAGAFLALAHKLEQHPLLWHFMSSSFAESFSEMATRIHDQPDFDATLVRLAAGLQSYPDLLKIMQTELRAMGVDLQIKSCRVHDGRKFCAVAIQDQRDAGNSGYIMMNGTTNVVAVDDIDRDDLRVRDEVLSLITRQHQELHGLALRAA